MKLIAIDTGETVLPGQIFSIPGQEVLVELHFPVQYENHLHQTATLAA